MGYSLDFILPHRCLLSGNIISQPGLDGQSWSRVHFLSPPLCDSCSLPLPEGTTVPAQCLPCANSPPLWQRTRTAFRYADGGRELILAFKHGDRTDATPILGNWLARIGRDLFDPATIILPVPLHWTRCFLRRYNPAMLLARHLAFHFQCVFIGDGLRRIRRTASQGRMTKAQRWHNLRGAISTHPRHNHRWNDAQVVIVDDMITSGATAHACTKALLSAGVKSVDLLTLARTGPRDQSELP